MEGWLVEVKMDLAMMAEKVDDIGTYAAGEVCGYILNTDNSDLYHLQIQFSKGGFYNTSIIKSKE